MIKPTFRGLFKHRNNHRRGQTWRPPQRLRQPTPYQPTFRQRFETLEDRRVLASISGQVIEDLNGNGVVDPGDPGQPGVAIYVDANDNGQLDRMGGLVEPDDFDDLQTILVDGVTLSMVDQNNDVIDDMINIVARDDAFASTGQRVFGTAEVAFFHYFQRLRFDFDEPVNSVAINFSGSRPFNPIFGALEVYDSSGNLLDRVNTDGLINFQYATLRLNRTEGDIAYAVAFTERPDNLGRFDSLRINDGASEDWTLSGAAGAYSLQNLPAGTHQIRQVVPDTFRQTIPAGGGAHQITVGADDEFVGVDFANAAIGVGSPWQNTANPLDVNDDGFVVALDALLIINELNQPKYRDPVSGELPAPPDPIPAFFDVTGDNFAVALDALTVINFLNSPNNLAAAAPASVTPKAAAGAVAAAAVAALDMTASEPTRTAQTTPIAADVKAQKSQPLILATAASQQAVFSSNPERFTTVLDEATVSALAEDQLAI